MKLLPHQVVSAEKFIEKNGRLLLWADVGTGKTATSIECAKRVEASRVLYICPAILKSQVAADFAVWWPEATVAVVTGPRPRRKELWASEADVWIANYEQLLVDLADIIEVFPDFIVVDECQRLAAPSSKTIKAFRKLSPKYRLAMSGTPAPNALYELWNMVDWVSPGIAHESFWQFRARECRMHPAFPKILGFHREEKVKKTFMSVVHRVRREDVLELPPLTEVRIPVTMGKEQREVYEKLKSDLMLELSSGETLTVPNMLALIMRLRQMADLPEVLGVKAESAKVKALDELLEAISSRKIIVFTEFASVARFLLWTYDEEAVGIMGETSEPDRQANLARFKTSSDVRLLIVTSAGQLGLNVQEADTVIHFDLPWNDARMDQRTARSWRYGQDKPVTSYRLICEKTVDEKMEKMVEAKRKATVDDLLDFFR